MSVGLVAVAPCACVFVSPNNVKRLCGLWRESIMQLCNSGRMLIHCHRQDKSSIHRHMGAGLAK